jgi:hypothetical protein
MGAGKGRTFLISFRCAFPLPPSRLLTPSSAQASPSHALLPLLHAPPPTRGRDRRRSLPPRALAVPAVAQRAEDGGEGAREEEERCSLYFLHQPGVSTSREGTYDYGPQPEQEEHERRPEHGKEVDDGRDEELPGARGGGDGFERGDGREEGRDAGGGVAEGGVLRVSVVRYERRLSGGRSRAPYSRGGPARRLCVRRTWETEDISAGERP